MHFCPNCGASLTQKIPPGDNRLRDVCGQCGSIHYENPRMVVGTVPIWDDLVLLCRRGIEPRYGYWTLPAGFLELGETTAQGAIRETSEEAGARIELGPAFTMFDVLHVGQVHLFYRAKLLDVEFHPGEESLETRLFAEEDIPWRDIAFLTVARTLEAYFADRRRGVFGMHGGDIQSVPKAAHQREAPLPSP